MRYAVISFDRNDEPSDWTQTDVSGLHGDVMAVLESHFVDYAEASAAKEEYERVKAQVDADPNMTIFSVLETFRAALAAHPPAKEWAEVESEVAAKIAPFSFSIKFTG